MIGRLGLRRLLDALPGAVLLPAAAWTPRHRWIVRLLWFHLVPLGIMGVATGTPPLHLVAELTPVAMLAWLAGQPWVARGLRSITASFGLIVCSALLVHLSGGVTELHFHFFVMLAVISLYHDWRPFLLSIGFVAVHHGVLGALEPEMTFNHPEAWRSPVKWAGIHAFFVLAASAAYVVSWRIVEDSDRDARSELEASERRFRALIENSSDVVTLIDAAGVTVYESPSAENVLGRASPQRVGASSLDIVHPDDLARAGEILHRLLTDGGAVSGIELRVRTSSGHHVWVDAAASNLLDDPAVGAIVCNFREITERKALEDELAHQAFHDSLTGLANRALLLDRVDHALQRTRTERAGTLALLFLDLDDFKTVNDGLGHDAGDTILRVVAERIESVLRPSDTPARLGGDEFAVLIEGLDDDPARAYDIGARLLEQLRTPFDVQDTLVAVNASLGIVVSDGSEDAATLLRNADLAMYRAKSAGKGRFEVYEAGMHAAVVERVALKADLRRAVEVGEIRPYYQPIVDLSTGSVIGVEALARWQHRERGLVAPAEFIPLAEETGLIVEIGEAILRQACTDAVRWQRDLPGVAPAHVSVNLSARQIQHPDVTTHVRNALEASGLPGEALILEITESVLLGDTDEMIGVLGKLKALGTRIALDDFGTGYSSLSYLNRFPVDIVKIDKSFIDSLAGATATPSPLVSAIVNLGALMGLEVTAEGIERIEQLTRLRNMGCNHGQGFFFAKPLPEAELRRMLVGESQHTAVRPT